MLHYQHKNMANYYPTYDHASTLHTKPATHPHLSPDELYDIPCTYMVLRDASFNKPNVKLTIYIVSTNT